MKKKWLGITLALLVVVVAAVAAVVTLGDTKADAATEYPLKLSVEKTTFGYKEDIVVSYTGLTEENFKGSIWNDVELRLENGHVDTKTSKRWDYIDMTLMVSKTGGGIDDKTPKRPTEGTVTFPDDSYSNSANYVSPGEYTLIAWDFDAGKLVAEPIHIVVSEYPLIISTDKVDYIMDLDEDIVIDFEGLTAAAFQKDDGSWHDIELRIDPGVDITVSNRRADYPKYINMTEGKTYSTTPTTVATGDSTFSETGTLSFASNKKAKNNAFSYAGQYTVWVMDCSVSGYAKVSNSITINVYLSKIDTNGKTQFAFGEDIVVNHTGLHEDFWSVGSAYSVNSEMLIYPENRWFSVNENYNKNNDRWGYPEGITDTATGSVCYVELGSQSTDTTYPNSVTPGSISCYEMNKKSPNYWPLAPGKYRIVMCYMPSGNVQRASNVIEIEVLPPEISVDKNQVAYGEDITVSYKNVGPLLRGSNYTEIGLFYEGDYVGNTKYQNLKFYVVNNATVNRCNDGSFSLKNDMVGSRLAADALLMPGKYFLALRTSYYTYDNDDDPSTSECNVCIYGTSIVEFTVVAPKITLSKSVYEFGESIELSYDYVAEAWLNYNSATYVSVDIFDKGHGCTGNAADFGVAGYSRVMEHQVWTKGGALASDGTEPSKKSSGSISFPEDDNDNRKTHFPLVPGEYRVVVRAGSYQINTEEYTFIVAEPEFKIQPELRDSISLHTSVLVHNDFMNVDGYERMLKMKFTFNGEEKVSTEYVTSVDPETGLTVYTFTYDNILPQQMMDAFSAEFIIDGNVYNPSTLNPASSLSIKKVSDYSIRQYADKILANDDYVSAHDLIVAMLNYGAEAQKYFDYNADNLANAGLTKSITNTAISNAQSALNVDGKCEDGYAWTAVTLDLQSKLAFRFKFTAKDLSKVAISCNGVTYTAASHPDQFLSAGNGKYYFYFRDIAANQFNTPYNLTLTVEGTTSTVTYSVNSFVAYIADKNGEGTALTDICTAIYNYGLLAASYNG